MASTVSQQWSINIDLIERLKSYDNREEKTKLDDVATRAEGYPVEGEMPDLEIGPVAKEVTFTVPKSTS